ncbi:helix-turn-helix domain-containing protein [Pseudomonas aeruginosa]|uniref:winged helix-turn-helix transcriptional regulator n=1 Tax=Pseudomonas aeruginosa TaxID=287 RepID=UPI0004527A51|nr:helix-turn-helix domain-containing protein [Pseudomonas aeruginosa]KAJ10240.1 HxlR family transcriptional regulator [Pseudomonas aeruginosa ID4365]MDP4470251.1 helix-turn-helix domain-containing protein [Pseudomonas aeruginosa]MDP4476412.1 helix-turn-helix domain-containing protein [Pseudomonas aeruginosa]
MRHNPLDASECPIARSLEHVGEWWNILILRDALQGLNRFDDFIQSLNIAPTVLTRRLNALVASGLLERRRYSIRPPRYEYVPSAKGEDFRVVLLALVAWGNKHYAQDGVSVQIEEIGTGTPLEVAFTDASHKRLVPLRMAIVRPGPAASDGMQKRLLQMD